MAMVGTGLQAEVLRDKYAPLGTALAGKMQVAVEEAKDARFWVEEYGKVLEHPETDSDEKMALRKTHILEQARARSMSQQAVQLREAIRSLRGLPEQPGPSVDQVREAYKGLDDLGAEGRSAWDQLLADRAASVEDLTEEFADALAEAEARHAELGTGERATQLLLDAGNHKRISATDAEFRVALRLPSLRSAAEFGFETFAKPEDRTARAQTTLIALVGYSRFFWDHYAGVRDSLGEGGLPDERRRNIFGVADGAVIKSRAIDRNERRTYFLSDYAKEKFNRRIRAIWGSEGGIAVSSWNEERAPDFFRACEGLASVTEGALIPNQELFKLLNEIDVMIEEELEAVRAIKLVRVRYESLLADASKLGDRAALSSAHYNAEIWAKDSKQAITGFDAAHQVLDRELAGSAREDWTPNTRGIAASCQLIGRMHSRFDSVLAVKKELAMLLR